MPSRLSTPPEVVFSEAQIAERVAEMAQEIADDPRIDTDTLLLMCTLRGAFVFAADLTRAFARIGLHPDLDFVGLASYGDGTVSSGEVSLTHTPGVDVKDRTVLLLDDIVDTGRSLHYARRLFLAQGAQAVYACALLDKTARREVALKPDFVGFPCPDRFVIGYGMDFAGKYRGLPYIGAIEG